MMNNAYQVYYENQIGGGRGGLEVYRGTRYQSGAGIGGIIKGIVKLGLPIFKKAASALGKHALSKGLELGGRVANDAIAGKSIKHFIKKRALQSGQQLLHKTTKKPKHRTSRKKAVSKKVPRDIFI